MDSEALGRIWGGGAVRVFISHRMSVDEGASGLKESLARCCGVAAFLDHEDIEPTQEWHREIEQALFSMDALIALLTEDFHESNWTDQEVGVAIGRRVPLIPVRLGRDPYGSMGKSQALSGCSLADTDEMALKIFGLLYKHLPDKSQLFECAVVAYAASESFADSARKVKCLLSLFENVPLAPEQVRRVVDAYETNDQNRGSYRGMELLRPLLEKWTGRKWAKAVKDDEPVLVEQLRGEDCAESES